MQDKMKVLFAVPPYYTNNNHVPYGIGIVATVAKNAGVDVTILLADAGEDNSAYNRRLIAEINRNSVNVLAIGGGSPHYPMIEELIKMVKSAGGGVTTVLGGFIVDSSPEIVARNIGADYCVYGEGEYTFLELMQTLQSNGDASSVKGLVFMRDGELVTTPPRKCIQDLDELPLIDTDLCHYDKALTDNPTLFLHFSRSCPYRCTFCYKMKGSHYRQRSLDSCFQELDMCIEKYGEKIIYLRINDELFNVSKERLMDFCTRIKKYKLKFYVQTRVDSLDEESIISLKNAGVHKINFGVESASNRVLKSMRKNYSIEQVKSAFALVERHGLNMNATLLFGDIEDDFDTVQENEALFREFGRTHTLRMTPISVFPGTYLHRYAIEKGIIKDELDFLKRGCPLINLTKLPDNIYWILIDKYSHLRIDSLVCRPLSNDRQNGFTIYNDGRMTRLYFCPICYTGFWETTSNRRVATFERCKGCGNQPLLFMAKDVEPDWIDIYLTQNISELLFHKYRGKRVVIYGVTDIIRRLIQSSQSLRDIIVKLVDRDWEQMTKENYCGLIVECPDTLQDFEFDYILCGAVYRRAEIVEGLKQMGVLEPRFIEFTRDAMPHCL